MTEVKKVLHILPDISLNAGMVSVVMNYYRFINRNLVQFDFLYFNESDETYKDEIKYLGGNVFCIGKPGYSNNFRKKCAEFFSKHRNEYDIVHCHPIWCVAMLGNIPYNFGCKHVIVHSHSTKFSNKRISAIRNRILMPVVRKYSTEYIACSEDAKSLLCGVKGNVFVLNNAIDIEKYLFNDINREQMRDELNLINKKVLINVGRLSVEKNQIFLLEVFKRLVSDSDEYMLLLVGEGPERAIIEDFIVRNELEDKVIILGQRNDVFKLLSAADVFILPSLFEGVPVSAVEAQASGLPCILSDTITRNINYTDMLFLSLEDSFEKWMACVKNTANSDVDRRNRGKQLLNGDFDINKVAKQLEEYYLQLS